MQVLFELAEFEEAARRGAKHAGIDIDVVDIKPVFQASKAFINNQVFDICELPLVTLIQALALGKPIGLLPVTTLGRFQHHTLVTLESFEIADLEGRSVGLRAWSQTTGVWVRGALSEQFGIDLRNIDWIVYEDGHVSELPDPDWVRRADNGANLQADFLEGKLDFGIMGNTLPTDDRIRTVLADPAQAAIRWYERTKCVPVNHVVAVSLDFARQHREAVSAVYGSLVETVAEIRGTPSAINLMPVGFKNLRNSFHRASHYGHEQGVIPRLVDYDEVVAQTCEAVGVSPEVLGG